MEDHICYCMLVPTISSCHYFNFETTCEVATIELVLKVIFSLQLTLGSNVQLEIAICTLILYKLALRHAKRDTRIFA